MRFVVMMSFLAACSSPSKPPTPTPVEPAPVEPAPMADAAPLEQAPPALDAGAAPVAIDAAPTLAAEGASCLKHADCSSGVCEGQGCFDSEPGTCAPAQRGCTRDLRSYCGCDGKTFKTSGSCPKQRYAIKGACATGTNRPAGAFCLKAGDCASKICEGRGCDDASPGRCADKQRACTADVVQFCTCDGRTTTGSSSCPGVRFAKRSTCDEDE
ncbi:MAG: hypothetical protein ACKV2T_39650 [Kofleriaceae bacterium]